MKQALATVSLGCVVWACTKPWALVMIVDCRSPSKEKGCRCRQPQRHQHPASPLCEASTARIGAGCVQQIAQRSEIPALQMPRPRGLPCEAAAAVACQLLPRGLGWHDCCLDLAQSCPLSRGRPSEPAATPLSNHASAHARRPDPALPSRLQPQVRMLRLRVNWPWAPLRHLAGCAHGDWRALHGAGEAAAQSRSALTSS